MKFFNQKSKDFEIGILTKFEVKTVFFNKMLSFLQMSSLTKLAGRKLAGVSRLTSRGFDWNEKPFRRWSALCFHSFEGSNNVSYWRFAFPSLFTRADWSLLSAINTSKWMNIVFYPVSWYLSLFHLFEINYLGASFWNFFWHTTKGWRSVLSHISLPVFLETIAYLGFLQCNS